MDAQEAGVTEAEVLAAIQRIATTQLDLRLDVKPADDLARDLDLDSVALITLALGLEEQFGIALPPEASSSVRTVADLCAIVVGERRNTR